MSFPYIAELRLVSWNFAAKGWAAANGQLLAIQQNQALFSLLGTTYGGNGQTNFALPNLQGRVAIHVGAGYVMGQNGGEANHTLTTNEMVQHNHVMEAVNTGQNQTNPNNNMFAVTTGNATIYGTAGPTAMLPADVTTVGGSQSHNNEQPYLVMNWLIALTGIFPSRN
ncbi:MAG TPA: tail fiber protein [Bryobacteraceae bacterium]|jgi:microcystin-dependent protein